MLGMAQKYIQVSSSGKSGNGFIAASALSEIAKCVLEDEPNVFFGSPDKALDKSIVNVVINRPILCREEKGKVNLYIHVSVRKGENASSLAGILQQEVSEQIVSTTELANCLVNIKIDGMF